MSKAPELSWHFIEALVSIIPKAIQLLPELIVELGITRSPELLVLAIFPVSLLLFASELSDFEYYRESDFESNFALTIPGISHKT